MSEMSDLQESGAAIGALASHPELFRAAAEAFLADDPERFQDALGRAAVLDRCHWICRWFCSKHCVRVCIKLVGPIEAAAEFDVEEWLAFGAFTAELAKDPDTLQRLVGTVAAEDAEGFRAFVEKHQIRHFAHQLCHWLCGVRCRVACRRLCPQLPQLIKVGYIPIGRIDPTGYANGPSSPSSFTPPPTPSAGVGDHPFSGSVHVNGLFGIAGAKDYKVEVADTAAGPWTAITTPIEDSVDYGFTTYTRVVGADDWYSIADMSTLSEGLTYLTDWSSPPLERNDLHYLRMVVRNTLGTEFPSGPVAVQVDNGAPVGPAVDGRPLIEFSQGGQPLECCSSVTKERGPITIHIEGTDENFSRLDVTAYGGCSGSIGIFSKTYNDDRTDTGAPSPGIDVTWDPWAGDVEPCCYVVFVRFFDRAITSNSWSGGHGYDNWRSITIG